MNFTAAQRLRNDAFRRSMVREWLMDHMTVDECAQYDVEGIIGDLAVDYALGELQDITSKEFAAIIAPHEYDQNGLTDAALAKAIERSRSGWVALIRRPDGDIQQLSLKQGAPDQTAEDVEKTLREFIQFPEGTVISILPLVG